MKGFGGRFEGSGSRVSVPVGFNFAAHRDCRVVVEPWYGQG